MTYWNATAGSPNTTATMASQDLGALEANNSTATPTPTVQPDTRDRAPANGPPAGWKPPADMKPPSDMQGGASPNGVSSGTASPTPAPVSSMLPSSSGGPGMTQGMTVGSGFNNGALTGRSLSQPSANTGASLYDYVSSLRPTIQPLFKS